MPPFLWPYGPLHGSTVGGKELPSTGEKATASIAEGFKYSPFRLPLGPVILTPVSRRSYCTGWAVEPVPSPKPAEPSGWAGGEDSGGTLWPLDPRLPEGARPGWVDGFPPREGRPWGGGIENGAPWPVFPGPGLGLAEGGGEGMPGTELAGGGGRVVGGTAPTGGIENGAAWPVFPGLGVGFIELGGCDGMLGPWMPGVSVEPPAGGRAGEGAAEPAPPPTWAAAIGVGPNAQTRISNRQPVHRIAILFLHRRAGVVSRHAHMDEG